MRQFMEEFSLFVKQFYRIIVWSVEKLQKLKIQKLQGQKVEECFYQNVQHVIVKSRNLSKNKKLVDY